MPELTNADRIALLAASIEDYLPGPWVGRWQAGAEGPSKRVACERCKGEGRVRTRKGIEPCEACGSSGRVLVDAYTGRVVAKAEQGVAAEVREALATERADFDARQRRRRRVDLLLGEERPGEDWVDWMLRRKRAQYRAGDYGRLEREVAALDEWLQESFWAVYGPEGAFRLHGARLRAAAGLALAWLDVLMPGCRVPGWLLAPRSRDDEIRRLNGLRMAQAEIAKRVGVSQSTVSSVLRGRVA